MKIDRFEDIEAWKAARELTKLVYTATAAKTFGDDVDLARQMRRAATSTMANIAEGFDAGSDSEFRRFLRIAQRSASEVQSHLYVALDRSYLDGRGFDAIYGQARQLKRLIGGFIRYLHGASSATTSLDDQGLRTKD
jgi:four helix bundle protein